MYLLYLTMKTPNGMTSLGIFLYSLLLAIVCRICIRREKYAVLRILCILPAFIALFHFGIYGGLTFSKFRYLYVEALIPLIYLLPGKKKIVGHLKAVGITLAVFIICFIFLLNSISHPYVHNFSRYSYTESFERMLDTLEKEYCLSSWKSMDYAALRERYLPVVEEAEKKEDEVLFAAVIKEVCYRFYDRHVSAYVSGSLNNDVNEYQSGNDYGLSMIRLNDGSVIAVCTFPDMEEYPCDVRELGIHDGTQILAWDGVEIDEAVRSVECIPDIFPVKSNEDIFRPIYLAGIGGDSVNVTFVNDEGEVQEVTLPRIDSYYNRFSWARAMLLHIDQNWDNYTYRMIDDKCGYLRVNAESYDSLKDDIAAARGGYYPELTEFYAGIIQGLKEQGMECLVVDIRNNNGGYDCVAGALASLFTDEKRHMVSFGYEDAQGYHIVEDQYIFPDGRYKDLPVVTLVNSDCVSAGDGMAKFLGDCDNVTLMGITAGSGVNQNNGGYIYLTKNICVHYPVFLSLSSDAEPLIDTDHSRVNRVPLEVTIPMTKEMALEMFDVEKNFPDLQDHELEYAVEFIENSRTDRGTK